MWCTISGYASACAVAALFHGRGAVDDFVTHTNESAALFDARAADDFLDLSIYSDITVLSLPSHPDPPCCCPSLSVPNIDSNCAINVFFGI